MINQKKKYNVNKEIRIKTPMLSDAYFVVKGTITVADLDNANINKVVAFKNNAPFINCISKINGAQIDNAEDLDVAMPMYNCLNTVKITEKQRAACEIITEMNHVILFLLILNLLNTRQVLQEILIMLVLVKLVITQTKLVKMKLKLSFH